MFRNILGKLVLPTTREKPVASILDIFNSDLSDSGTIGPKAFVQRSLAVADITHNPFAIVVFKDHEQSRTNLECHRLVVNRRQVALHTIARGYRHV